MVASSLLISILLLAQLFRITLYGIFLRNLCELWGSVVFFFLQAKSREVWLERT